MKEPNSIFPINATLRALGVLDKYRGILLHYSSRLLTFRRIYQNRTYRLSCWFLAAFIVYLPLALICGPAVLVIGPLIFGIPHLLSTYRYIPRFTGDSAKVRYRGMIFCGMAALFLCRIIFPSWSSSGAFPEIVAVLIGASGMRWLSGDKISKYITASLGIMLLIVALNWSPLVTVGFLALAHNFVAFFYWIVSARSNSDRPLHAWAAFALFAAATAFILTGGADGLVAIGGAFAPISAIPRLSGVVPHQIARQIYPFGGSEVMLDRVIAAAALGQSLHYFVWLKAIPEELQKSSVPFTFRRGFRLAVNDIGITAVMAVGIATGLLLVGAVVLPALARQVYLCLAAAHGYLELGALPAILASNDGDSRDVT